MSTSEKLTYLNGTKQALKESINNIGGDITNETTFREYAQELDNIYDNLPKTTGEDTTLSLTTLKGKMNTTLKGDTQQTQYSGYNILENKMANSVSRNGITYTKREDGSVLVNGTATGLSYCVLTNTAGNINDYTTALFTMGSSFYCTPQNDINSVTMQYRLTNGDYKNYSNLASNDVIGLAYLQVNSGVTINNLVVYPMIVNGSSAVKPYEPYVGGTASPNPTYPQNIEVVTGTQTITISNSDNTETQTQTISLGDIELCKIGNYQDYLYKSNDKWYKKENIYKKILNGTETINVWTNNRFTFSEITNYKKVASTTTSLLLSTHYKATARNLSQTDFTMCFYDSNESVSGLILCDSIHNTLSTLQTWLGTNNVTLYYVLATPQDIEITNTTLIEQLNNLEKLKSYNGVTNISSSGNLSAILNVSAIKGES